MGFFSDSVHRYPTLDFHGGSQRLAVGTSEGAVMLYDLKTATRLYVLEGHRKRLSGISFSPDGRRMVTLSIEESIVLVWKVGTSFVSFFNPGAPPRQGHAGSDPYKSLPFVLQDQGASRPLFFHDRSDSIFPLRFVHGGSNTPRSALRMAIG